jgi:hypothetical protein
MVQLDALSRRPDYGAEGQFNDKKKTVLPEDLFKRSGITMGYCEDVPQS